MNNQKNKNIRTFSIFITIFTVVSLSGTSFVKAESMQTEEATSTNRAEKKAELLEKKAESVQKKTEKKAEIIQQKTEKIRTAADKELDKRIEDLSKLATKIQGLKNISDANKTSIIAVVNELTANLTNLKNEIDTTTSTTTLKNDRELITKNYRVYALVMPRLNIVAAADRVITITSMMSDVGIKLESRLNAASTSTALTTLFTKLTEYKAKIANASTEANGAMELIANLVPDQGDKTVLTANNTALKAARTKIKTAEKDIAAAHKIANEIVKALKKAE